jgi:hypothetical protein
LHAASVEVTNEQGLTGLVLFAVLEEPRENGVLLACTRLLPLLNRTGA